MKKQLVNVRQKFVFMQFQRLHITPNNEYLFLHLI